MTRLLWSITWPFHPIRPRVRADAILNPLMTLGYIAGVTERIRIGISVLVMPYRPAVLTAKQLATLQELSDNRVILGGRGRLAEARV